MIKILITLLCQVILCIGIGAHASEVEWGTTLDKPTQWSLQVDVDQTILVEEEKEVSLPPVSLQADSSDLGYCQILFPGGIDQSNRRCADASRYAALYEGKILDNRCYKTIDEVFRKIEGSLICRMSPPAQVRHCEIMGPGQRDVGRRFCNNPNFYAVTYDGHITDGRCFATADEALDQARYTKACRRRAPLRVGQCLLLNPGQTDQNNLKCVSRDFYAYTYSGHILGGKCFATIDETLNEMRNNSLCR